MYLQAELLEVKSSPMQVLVRLNYLSQDGSPAQKLALIPRDMHLIAIPVDVMRAAKFPADKPRPCLIKCSSVFRRASETSMVTISVVDSRYETYDVYFNVEDYLLVSDATREELVILLRSEK